MTPSSTLPLLAILREALVFCLGAALLVAVVRWWRPDVSLRASLGYVALVSAFFAAPLFTGALQVPTDIAYQWRPWREMTTEQVRPQNALLSDTLLEQVPFHALVRQRLLALEAPLWSHELGTGQPLLGNAQSAPFAPLHLLALPLPPLRALSVSAAWEVLLNLLLMHALLLRLGAGRWGAPFGAVAAGLSTYAVAWAYDTLGMVAAWVPGVLLGLVLLRRGERGGGPGLVTCAYGLAAGGHPETLAHTALAAAAVTGALLCDPAPGRGRFLLRLAAATALTAALCAPLLLPVVETLARSDRKNAMEVWGAAVQSPPQRLSFLLPLIDPLAFGSPRDGNWNGPWNFNELCTDYAGLIALAAALAGAIAFRGRILAILLGGGAALLAALHAPPFYNLVHALPLFGQGAIGRLRLFWVLAVAAAGGLSIDRLAAERRGRLAAAAALLVLGATLAAVPPASAPVAALWQRAWWIAALAAAAVSLAALLTPRLHGRFAALAFAGLALDLVLLGMRYQPVLAPRYDLAAPPALAFLATQERGAAEPFRVLAQGDDLHPNLAAFYGLWDPRAYDPMQPFDAARFWRRRQRLAAPELSLATDAYLGVRYRLTRHRQSLPPPWRPVLDDQGGTIWENPEALPLFFMPRRLLRVADPQEVYPWLWGVRALRDFRDLAIAVARGEASSPDPLPQQGVVRSIRPGSNRFDLEIDSATGGTVVSSVSWAPGWRVEVDGRESTAFEVNSAFLGFAVPSGAHAVHLRYRPVTWTWGLALAALGLAAALASRLCSVLVTGRK